MTTFIIWVGVLSWIMGTIMIGKWTIEGPFLPYALLTIGFMTGYPVLLTCLWFTECQ